MPSGLHLVHVHPTSVVEPERTDKAPVSVRDRLSPTREGKLQWKFCLHPPSRAGRDAFDGKKPQLWMPLFSYRWELMAPEPLL